MKKYLLNTQLLVHASRLEKDEAFSVSLGNRYKSIDSNTKSSKINVNFEKPTDTINIYIKPRCYIKDLVYDESFIYVGVIDTDWTITESDYPFIEKVCRSKNIIPIFEKIPKLGKMIKDILNGDTFDYTTTNLDHASIYQEYIKFNEYVLNILLDEVDSDIDLVWTRDYNFLYAGSYFKNSIQTISIFNDLFKCIPYYNYLVDAIMRVKLLDFSNTESRDNFSRFIKYYYFDNRQIPNCLISSIGIDKQYIDSCITDNKFDKNMIIIPYDSIHHLICIDKYLHKYQVPLNIYMLNLNTDLKKNQDVLKYIGYLGLTNKIKVISPRSDVEFYKYISKCQIGFFREFNDTFYYLNRNTIENSEYDYEKVADEIYKKLHVVCLEKRNVNDTTEYKENIINKFNEVINNEKNKSVIKYIDVEVNNQENSNSEDRSSWCSLNNLTQKYEEEMKAQNQSNKDTTCKPNNSKDIKQDTKTIYAKEEIKSHIEQISQQKDAGSVNNNLREISRVAEPFGMSNISENLDFDKELNHLDNKSALDEKVKSISLKDIMKSRQRETSNISNENEEEKSNNSDNSISIKSNHSNIEDKTNLSDISVSAKYNNDENSKHNTSDNPKEESNKNMSSHTLFNRSIPQNITGEPNKSGHEDNRSVDITNKHSSDIATESNNNISITDNTSIHSNNERLNRALKESELNPNAEKVSIFNLSSTSSNKLDIEDNANHTSINSLYKAKDKQNFTRLVEPLMLSPSLENQILSDNKNKISELYKDNEVITEILNRPINTIILDYDGTLVPLMNNPSECFLPEKTKDILIALCRKFKVVISSGRSKEDMDKFVPSEMEVFAEHCSFQRVGGKWKSLDKSNTFDLEYRMALFYQNRTPGSVLEKKENGFVFHYRNCAEDIGKFQAKKLYTDLLKITNNVQLGNKIVEYKVNKKNKIFDYYNSNLLLAGDDVTDEDMFEKDKGVSIKVGYSKDSKAEYYVKDVESFTKFLEILESSK